MNVLTTYVELCDVVSGFKELAREKVNRILTKEHEARL